MKTGLSSPVWKEYVSELLLYVCEETNMPKTNKHRPGTLQPLQETPAGSIQKFPPHTLPFLPEYHAAWAPVSKLPQGPVGLGFDTGCKW